MFIYFKYNKKLINTLNKKLTLSMTENELFEEIASIIGRVADIEENYIRLSDVEGKFVSNNDLDNYFTKSEIEETYLTIQEGNNIKNNIKSLNDKIDNQDLSIFITNDEFNNFKENIKSEMSDNTLDMSDYYTKTDIDKKISEISSTNLDDYLKLDDFLEFDYITLDELNNILDSKNYITDLTNYLKISDFNKSIDSKLDNEFNSLKEFYDTKIDEIRDLYINAINNGEFVSKEDVINSITQSLTDYISTSKLNEILNNKDFVDTSTLANFVEQYVTSKISKLNFVKPDDIKDFAHVSDIPTKISDLVNDSSFLTKHQSLIGYAKKSDLNDYVTQTDFYKTISALSNSDTTVDIDLTGYVKLIDIPTKLSDLVNDEGYLKQHQSLAGYVKRNELNKYATQADIEDKYYSLLSSIEDGSILPKVDLTGYAKLSDIPAKTSDLINDSGFLTSHQSLDNYAKKNDLNDYVLFKDYHNFSLRTTSALESVATKDDIKDFAHVSDIPTKISDLVNDSSFLTEHQSLDGYVKYTELGNYVLHSELKSILDNLEHVQIEHVDLTGYAKLTDIPIKISELVNDEGYLKQHQSLSAYVKKSELDEYVTESELDEFKKSLETSNNETFLTNSDLENYITKDFANSVYMLKSDRPNLSEYSKKTDLNNYVKKTSLPDFNKFAHVQDLPDFNEFVTKNNIDIFEFAKKSDIPDTSKFVNIDSLNHYIKVSDFEKFKKTIESKGYQTKLEVDDILESYVKKSELGTVSKLDIDNIQNMIMKGINSVNIPTKTSDLINDSGFLTKHQSLSGYVKRSEISSFITMDDADRRFMKVSDFVLPDNILYKKDLKEYTTQSDLTKSTMNVVHKSQLKDYVLNNDLKKQILSIEKSFNTKLSDIENKLDNFEPDNSTTLDLSEYVRKDDINDFAIFEDFANIKYAKNDVMKSYIKTLDDKINTQKTWVNENFIKKSEYAGDTSTSTGDINLDALFNDYYTKAEAHVNFLSKEDYRGIKTAATINFEFNDYPDLFFEVLNNVDNVKINDGFYVIEEKAYIIRNNQIVPICDRRTPHWEIETTDEDWRNDIDGLRKFNFE